MRGGRPLTLPGGRDGWTSAARLGLAKAMCPHPGPTVGPEYDPPECVALTGLTSDVAPPANMPAPDEGEDGPAAKRSRRGRHRRLASRRRFARPRFVAPVAGLVVVLLAAGPLVGAARTPGNEAYTAKVADWLRSHHGSALVTPMESWYYKHQAPGKGGRLRALNPLPPSPLPPSAIKVPDNTLGPISAPIPVATHLPAPAAVPLVVTPGLAQEGEWQPVGGSVNGQPGMYEAQFRADSTYTSQITSAVWIDPTVLTLSLVPGAREPGGTWSTPPNLSGPAAASARAAFNGGFRFEDAHGGFYLDGREAVPLQEGAASVVIYADGRVNIGAWGSEVAMGSDVKAVLQNLVPIVDKGQPAPSATYGDSRIWGNTLGANAVVARSGLGTTATGALVFVAGPALTALTLAESLQRAGAVRAMTLDINPEWVTFNYFNHGADGAVTPSKLYPSMQRPADRYLGPTDESRDFFAVSVPLAIANDPHLG